MVQGKRKYKGTERGIVHMTKSVEEQEQILGGHHISRYERERKDTALYQLNSRHEHTNMLTVCT